MAGASALLLVCCGMKPTVPVSAKVLFKEGSLFFVVIKIIAEFYYKGVFNNLPLFKDEVYVISFAALCT